MRNKFRSILILICVLLLALAGCGRSAAPAQGTDSSVPMTEFKVIDKEEAAEEPEAEITEESEAEITEEPEAERPETAEEAEPETAQEEAPEISESDTPTEKDELAAYIHRYGHLPANFITKREAKERGWVSTKGNLWDVAPGCSIGGDYYTNYEGTLPDAPGREYTECDVGYEGGYRDARRIVFSNDGLIYYTGDHYETFELLYGEE